VSVKKLLVAGAGQMGAGIVQVSAVAGLVGLDTTKAVLETFERELSGAKYRPAEILGELVAAGNLGRKSGAGFYDYGS
jgi:3-hydroxybutyryl-CoA dehydrogenase